MRRIILLFVSLLVVSATIVIASGANTAFADGKDKDKGPKAKPDVIEKVVDRDPVYDDQDRLVGYITIVVGSEVEEPSNEGTFTAGGSCLHHPNENLLLQAMDDQRLGNEALGTQTESNLGLQWQLDRLVGTASRNCLVQGGVESHHSQEGYLLDPVRRLHEDLGVRRRSRSRSGGTLPRAALYTSPSTSRAMDNVSTRRGLVRKITLVFTALWLMGWRRTVTVLVGLLALVIIVQFAIGYGVGTHCTGACP